MADEGSTISDVGKSSQKTLQDNKKGKFKTSQMFKHDYNLIYN